VAEAAMDEEQARERRKTGEGKIGGSGGLLALSPAYTHP